jgi:hypothetical protein
MVSWQTGLPSDATTTATEHVSALDWLQHNDYGFLQLGLSQLAVVPIAIFIARTVTLWKELD